MSKIKDRIEEINKSAKKSRTINTILWVVVMILGLGAIGLGFWADNQRSKAETLTIEADSLKTLAKEALEQIEKNEKATKAKLDALVKKNSVNLWDQAKTLNTLESYSAYYESNANDTIHRDSLNVALSNLLNNEGYVQIIETGGRKLYEDVTLDLPISDFIKFKTDLNVRRGIIGDPDFSSSSKKGVILKDQIVRIVERKESNSSKSVWAKIAYSN